MKIRSLEKFAQTARLQLQEQVASKLERVLKTDSAELRGKAQAIQTLQRAIATTSRAAVIERVAYTWFNRFCALRYMDANHYTRTGAVSPAAGFTQPEILQEAKQGHIDEELPVNRETVLGLLNGRLPSSDAQQEAYRLLLVAVCNSYHATMPFLFERIDDYTELLMPDDLLSAGSILQATRDALTDEACQDIEVIGWLYQFYIAEKKDEVFAALKKGQKIRAEDIPAASQLFTPHWIVRYMVENSLGRLWLLNRPHSTLAQQMEFYIAPEEAETDFLRVQSPEEIKLCDPAAGSGHILTYAFDLLYAIYEEEGYNPADIPRLILEKNLFGMEIDERAGALAAFALVMKARAKDRRFFSRTAAVSGGVSNNIRPNVCVLQKLEFSDAELKGEVWIEESGSAKAALLHDLHLFAEADNFGSLLRPQLSAEQITALRWRMEAKRASGQSNWLEQERREKIERALTQAEYLAQSYHVVVANPPYMGGGGMNDAMKEFAGGYYPASKSDLFAMFIERNLEFAQARGYVGMITMQSWMFLPSFEQLRAKILNNATIDTMAHLGARAFDTIGGEVVSTTAFTIKKHYHPTDKGAYVRLVDGRNEAEKAASLQAAIAAADYHRATVADFKKIPGAPISYWASKLALKAFENGKPLSELYTAKSGVMTGNDELFLREWYEVEYKKIGFGYVHETQVESGHLWLPMNKENGYRKWSGRYTTILQYIDHGRNFSMVEGLNYRLRDTALWFKPGISWGDVTGDTASFRYQAAGLVFQYRAKTIFTEAQTLIGFLNSKPTTYFQQLLNPTLSFNQADLDRLPVLNQMDAETVIHIESIISNLIDISETDWNLQEVSWNYSSLHLLDSEFHSSSLANTYTTLRCHWKTMMTDTKQLEQENSRIFIEVYDLQDQLTPEVPLDEITLTCNPHYRYGGNRSETELEALLLADTMREFISYAVGCMVGRYSLDKPGLILANQGETLEDYLRQVPSPTYTPDRDNVIPILDGEWFSDDIVARFSRFLRLTFGDANYQENIAFIEKAIGRDLRSYFLRDFYDHHIKMYQKRPIYWLFSSPKGSFNALIYMHRYRPDTVSVVLNDYLREFRTKLTAHRTHLQQVTISASATQRDKTKAVKEIGQIDKALAELIEYENETLYPLATQRVEIDLDDGVKVNYNKFGKALKRVPGLSE